MNKCRNVLKSHYNHLYKTSYIQNRFQKLFYISQNIRFKINKIIIIYWSLVCITEMEILEFTVIILYF